MTMTMTMTIVYGRQVSSQFWLSLLHYGIVIADYHRS